MKISKKVFFGTLLIALAGCGANVQPDALSKLGAAPTVEEVTRIAHGSPIYRLDYLAGGQAYIYQTYRATGTDRYYGMLFHQDTLIAVDIVDRQAAFWPASESCTVSPPASGQDVDACLTAFGSDVTAKAVGVEGAANPQQAPMTPSPSPATNGAAKVSKATQQGTLTVTSIPIVLAVPEAILLAPVVAASSAIDSARTKSLGLELGLSYEAISPRVEKYPPHDRLVTNGNGTVIVPSLLLSKPAAAFGVQGGKVIWIDRTPHDSCGSDYTTWGMACASQP